MGQGDWREELCRECNLTLYRQLFTKWSFDVESFGNRDSLCNAPQRLPCKVDSPLRCRNSYVRGLIELEDNPASFVCQSHLNRRPQWLKSLFTMLLYQADFVRIIKISVIKLAHLFCEQAERNEVKRNK